MPTATARIVVQTTPQEKRAIAAKARALNMSISDLMRSGASAFNPDDPELRTLIEAAHASAQRSIAAIDDTLTVIAESNARIAAMETRAVQRRRRSHDTH